jgi:hypothetical protein
MTIVGITHGLFAVSSATWTAADLKQALDWLRVEYQHLGLDPRRIRRDVLDYAARRNLIATWPYAELLGLHCQRHVLMRRNVDMGAANDDDLYEIPYERAANSRQTAEVFEAFRRCPKISAAVLPKVTWSPFRAPIARARCLTREQLVEMRACAH